MGNLVAAVLAAEYDGLVFEVPHVAVVGHVVAPVEQFVEGVFGVRFGFLLVVADFPDAPEDDGDEREQPQ